GDDAHDGRHVQRRREVVHHRVQKLLHTLVLEGGAAEDRGEMQAHGTLADGGLQLRLAQRLSGEVAGQQLVALLAGNFHQLPPTAQNTPMAPSSTRRDRSTSAVKSTWPGVSMMLMRWSFHSAVVAAEVMVMPRSCSWTIQSMVAVPSCTSPILWVRPV